MVEKICYATLPELFQMFWEWVTDNKRKDG